jgi:hypothetical protein
LVICSTKEAQHHQHSTAVERNQALLQYTATVAAAAAMRKAINLLPRSRIHMPYAVQDSYIAAAQRKAQTPTAKHTPAIPHTTQHALPPFAVR